MCYGVIDGDMIEVELDGQTEKVRYIGSNTPEIKHPTKDVEPFGKAGSAANRALVEGQTVRLEYDVQHRDRYGQLVACIYVGDIMVNGELVRQGYAQVATYPPNVKYQKRFLALQREARGARRGLWEQ